MPTDHLPNHGMSAASKSLCPSFYGGMTEYLRGGWECLRGDLVILGELEIFTGQFIKLLNIYGEYFEFTRSILNLRGKF